MQIPCDLGKYGQSTRARWGVINSSEHLNVALGNFPSGWIYADCDNLDRKCRRNKVNFNKF